ncbi:hypothetical protein [Planococcus sp. YIM B11945]|uniref:hypothetical protein n=1 Tax=Planococcus sp. YIM B11945 TaxID=3435410 RepID=UPI003D7CC7EE
MAKNASEEYDEKNHAKDVDTLADKVVDRAQKFMGVDDEKGNNDAPFQNAPDEDTSDVPKKDKVITDHRTGKKTHVKNTGDQY